MASFVPKQLNADGTFTDRGTGITYKPGNDLFSGPTIVNNPNDQPAPTAPNPSQQYMNQMGQLTQFLQGQQNPYSMQNPAYQQYVSGLQQQAMMQFAPQQSQLSGALAGRGMMGGGQEVAARNALQGQQAAQLANIGTQAAMQNYQNASNWDTQRQGQIAALLGQQEGFRQNQQQFEANQAAQQQAAQNQMISGLLGAAGTIGGMALGSPIVASLGGSLAGMLAPKPQAPYQSGNVTAADRALWSQGTTKMPFYPTPTGAPIPAQAPQAPALPPAFKGNYPASSPWG
jgi:hypothetical protein